MYSNPSNPSFQLQMQQSQLDQIFFNSSPQTNPEIFKKAVYLGINYFSGFKGQKGKLISCRKMIC